jgi:hypothetical protein
VSMATASKTRLNFLCPTATVKRIIEMAEADHRDKSSMLNKIVDFYLQHHTPNGQPLLIMGETKPTTHRTKVGSR